MRALATGTAGLATALRAARAAGLATALRAAGAPGLATALQAVALTLALSGCSVWGGEEEAEEEVPAYVLDAPVYRFCHEPGFQPAEARAWCDLIDEIPEERCPGLHETCADPTLEAPAGCLDGLGGGGMPGSTPSAPETPRTPPEACQLPESSAASLGSLVKWVGAIGVAVIVLVVLRLLMRFFGRDEPPPAPARVVVDEPEEEEALPDVPDLPSGDLLGQARASLDAGRYGEAALLARGAALRRLGETGKLRLHRSRTDREYVRQVRSEADLGDALRQVIGAVEVHRFGGRALDADGARRALDAADRILRAVVVLGLLLGSARADAQGFGRHGPFGDAALFDLFEDYGYQVSWLAGPLAEVDEDADAVVLDLVGLEPTEEDWEGLRGWVEAGGVLLVAGDASVAFPELGSSGFLAVSSPTELVADLDPYLPAPHWPEGVDLVWVDGEGQPWVMAVGREAPPADDEDGEGEGEPLPGMIELAPGEERPVIVALDVGEGVVLAIADPLLLTNGALVHPANEAFLGEALHVGQGPLGWPLPTPVRVVLATRASASSDAPSAAAANPRLIPFVLQLLLTWTLLGLWKGVPFGVLRDPPGEGRLRFVDHISALATRYMRLGATGYAKRAVARLWLARLGPAGLELAARRAGYDGDAAKRLVSEAEVAADGPGDGRDPADLDWVEELWRVTRRR